MCLPLTPPQNAICPLRTVFAVLLRVYSSAQKIRRRWEAFFLRDRAHRVHRRGRHMWLRKKNIHGRHILPPCIPDLQLEKQVSIDILPDKILPYCCERESCKAEAKQEAYNPLQTVKLYLTNCRLTAARWRAVAAASCWPLLALPRSPAEFSFCFNFSEESEQERFTCGK